MRASTSKPTQGALSNADGIWRVLRDNSVVAESGRVVFFSNRRFKRAICRGDCCFICGLSPRKTTFNDEHILPEWLLRRFKLFQREITLPNRTTVRYGQYTIQCCSACNSLLGAAIEQPVRELVAGGHQAVADQVREKGPSLLFVWLALIFVKTHLRDRDFRADRDLRVPSGPISSMYKWGTLHHLHCVARIFFSGAELDPQVFGTIMILPAKVEPASEPFDFVDLYLAQTMLMRIEDVAILCVFDDGGAVAQYLIRILKDAPGPFSAVQLREILADAAACNLHLLNRPIHHSIFDIDNRRTAIVSELRGPAPAFAKAQRTVRGAFMEYALRSVLGSSDTFIGFDTPNDFWDAVRQGSVTLLFDNEGRFITEHFRPLPNAQSDR